ncbi:MAG: NAD(P)-dependent glycerol-3-phosphate dehydrogenase [Gemmatimonadetes bacterium]|uniref:Glycerol-3-phosphate dehydrogenase [NAD(P)+] n=1 Tax=Candidatus Kutchimonas denitrificans TaxID=3056748 RepID=A0AAE4Z9Y7_9BACT|nr:NAD(P)-dependent glycerol-3-phosphate dehydrogenase [Gemmatimonadota bacterium]NIR75262.1 NAD(P)-dependent glycerol-3-phosphate dehydrogenase [Candidatus Kutchimonas denitrificans]NIS00200.1 NAD(P)-dependent glycerol-3-phosphate dehydrogenase [Gemmatimonadota bacterium]NIT65792.1 NAD(P)-dependent glycerol-3-phosphate dehydrogenase [Gemmatimonadota bacterium]NIU53070.1 NAD(P)H-dependent glycerol-3-phosphate dehydrogenase [Gemmatimonadota bacterium]
MGRATVIGAGSWGTALAKVLAEKGHRVRLWCYEASVAEGIADRHENLDYLPGVRLPDTIEVYRDHAESLEEAELVVAVVPSQWYRQVMSEAAPHVPADARLVTATKGIEIDTLERPSEILIELLPEHEPTVLCGPSFAVEVAEGDPTAIVAASRDADVARFVQEFFNTERFRVYTNDDIPGVELAAALKNIIALASGITVGLGYRHNSRAALITRGLAEMTRLGLAMGAKATTFAGLAGLGDLVLTCNAELSRNRTVGVRLGEGESLDDILSGMRSVAEGVRTTRAARELASRHGVEMPIVDEVHHILFNGKSPRQATADLMLREPKPELWGGADAT